MPTRNRDDLISDTILSIVSQSETDWELIIVDDHSDPKDSTEQVVKSFHDERIHYYHLDDQSGMGIAAARNFGNAIATGEFIAIMDSDDICYQNRFELSLNKIESDHSDLVYGGIDYWHPEDNSIEKPGPIYAPREFNLEDFRRANFIPHSTVMVRAELTRDFPYNTFFKVAEDYDFLSRLIVTGHCFSFINQSLVKYRFHPGRTSVDQNFAEMENKIKGFRRWI